MTHHLTTTLGRIAKISSGGTPDRTKASYWSGSIPWVKTAQIQNGVIRADDIDEWISQEGFEKSSARMIPKGTILMAMYGQGKTRGQVAILGLDATINQACAAIQLKAEANRDYVFQQLRFRYNAIRALSNTGSQENLNADLIREIAFPLPPSQEQERTAEILNTWDTAIEKTEQLIAVKAEQYLALVGCLIIRPAHKDTAWKHKRLRDIATRIQRKAGEGEYPILTISSASGFILQEEKYGRYMAGESVKDYIPLRRGEFAYNKGNSLRYQFGCVYQLMDYEEALVPHVYVCFNLHENISDAYMRHLFAVDYLKPQLGKLVKTGVRNNGLLNIRPDEFLDATVPIPSLEKQLSIAAALDAASAEIALLKQQVSAYRIQKRGLMQKLLTGQWRLPLPPGVTHD